MASSAKRVIETPERKRKKGVKTKAKDTYDSGGTPPKGPIRLNPDILKTASLFADIGYRSVPNQIEYWAKLGQLLENALTTAEVHHLLAGTKYLTNAEVRDQIELDSDSIISLVDSARTDGSISEELASSEFVYDTDSANRLRRIDSKGNVTFGKIVGNKFVEISSSS